MVPCILVKGEVLLLVIPLLGHQQLLSCNFAVSTFLLINFNYQSFYSANAVELQTNNSTVAPSVNDSSVDLSCEMSAFIRPDSSLIWEGPGGRRITDEGTGRYHITFSDGSPEQAVNRSTELVPSRVSTLTVFNLEPSDAGDYTCSVIGTDQAITIQLILDDSEAIFAATAPSDNLIPGPEDEATYTTISTPILIEPTSLIPIIVGSVAGVLCLLAIVLSFFILCILFKHKRSKQALNITTSYNYPIYDYPTHLPEDNDYQVVDKRTIANGGMISDAVMERNEAYGLSPCALDEDYCELSGTSPSVDFNGGGDRIIVARNEAYGENSYEQTEENIQGN